jgi:hypothetical protein
VGPIRIWSLHDSDVTGSRRDNEAAARALADRVVECAAALRDVLAAAPRPLAPGLALELERLPPLLRRCAAFVESFSKKTCVIIVASPSGRCLLGWLVSRVVVVASPNGRRLFRLFVRRLLARLRPMTPRG